MSEQYYMQEDLLADTPRQALENFQAQSTSLANVVPEIATALQQTGEALGLLYDQAQAIGNVGAMALISASWQRTEIIANQAVQLDAVRGSAAAVINTINEERLRVTAELSGIEDALSDFDDHHPSLRDFAATFRQEGAEEAQAQAEECALEYAFEVSYDSICENLVQLTGCSWQQINRFIGILQGNYETSEVLDNSLKALIESLEVEREGGF